MKNFNLNLCAEPGCETCVSKSSPYAFCAQHDRDNKRVTRIREHRVANYLREAEMPWTRPGTSRCRMVLLATAKLDPILYLMSGHT